MKIKITNTEIVEARIPLSQLVAQKFPVRVAYDLAKLGQKINDRLKAIEEARNNLINKYGEKNDKGQMFVGPTIIKKDAEGNPVKDKEGKDVTEPNPNAGAFSKEYLELLNIEEEIDITPVKLPQKVASTCDKCHHNMDRELEIEPSILMALDKFIEIA